MKKEMLIEIEKIEKRYLDQMVFMLYQDIDKDIEEKDILGFSIRRLQNGII